MTSCIKERCKPCDQTIDPGLKCITFTGDYSVFNQTKGGSKLFPAGIQTSIVTYNAGDNPISKGSYPGTPIGATSEANGNLVLNGGAYLFIPNGIYDFYSVSSNTSSIPLISFTNGISDGLSNGTDYLWASYKNMNIVTNTFVPLQFSHRSAAISLSIVSGEGIISLVVNNIMISQAKEGASMTLSSGFIRAADALSADKALMIIVGNAGTFITLPVKAGISLPVEVYADVCYGNHIVVNKKFATVIPAPVAGFESGTLYKYTASVDAYRIMFLNSTLEDWNDQSLVNISLVE